MSAWRLSVILVLLFVMASAIALVYVKHNNRVLFVKLQVLEQEARVLEEEWGRLLLEQSALLAHGQVESIVRKKLKMSEPENIQTVVVR